MRVIAHHLGMRGVEIGAQLARRVRMPGNLVEVDPDVVQFVHRPAHNRRGRQAICDRTRRAAPDSHAPPRGTWRWPAGERLRNFTIVATLPNEPSAELRDRMSVVLTPEGDQPGSTRSPRTRPSSKLCFALSGWGDDVLAADRQQDYALRARKRHRALGRGARADPG